MFSYRPISLIPTESKIITKILANRLTKYIGSIINQDQTGFMPKRHIYFNLRRLLNIIYNKKNIKTCYFIRCSTSLRPIRVEIHDCCSKEISIRFRIYQMDRNNLCTSSSFCYYQARHFKSISVILRYTSGMPFVSFFV